MSVLAQVDIPLGDDMVLCYASNDCSGGAVSGGNPVTRVACCDNQIDPVGYSAFNDGEQGCRRCPIGWSCDN